MQYEVIKKIFNFFWIMVAILISTLKIEFPFDFAKNGIFAQKWRSF